MTKQKLLGILVKRALKLQSSRLLPSRLAQGCRGLAHGVIERFSVWRTAVTNVA